MNFAEIRAGAIENSIAMLSRRLQLMEADPRPITMPEFKKSVPAKDADKSDDKPATDEGNAPAKDDKPETKTDDESKS